MGGITKQGREDRRQGVGGSDLSALYGYYPVYPVWVSKVFGDDDEPNEAMQWGTDLQDVIANRVEDVLGPIDRDQLRLVPDSRLRPNVDFIVTADGIPGEIKTSGITGPVYGEWGEAGTDEVPEPVILQCHGHMIATEADVCHVFALIGCRGLVQYQVHRVESLAQDILARVARFWEECVVAERAPDESWGMDAGPTMDAIKGLRRAPNKTVKLPDANAIDYWEKAKAFKAFAANIEEQAKARALGMLGDAEAAELPDGRWLTYMDYGQKKFDKTAFGAAHPELLREFTKKGPMRRAYVKKHKPQQLLEVTA